MRSSLLTPINTSKYDQNTAIEEIIDEIKVLHIDDDKSFLELSSLMIKDADPGLNIKITTDPEEVLRDCMEHDVIVTDYVMPSMNGITLAEKIRDKCDVPIIIYTGQGSEEVAEAAFEAGINDYIRKELEPANKKVLAKRIRAAVERYRALKELKESRDSLARAQEVALLGNWDWNIKHDEVYFSDMVYRILDLEKDDFESNYQAFLDMVHPMDLERVQDALEDAISSNKEYNIDHRIVLPGDEVRFVNERAKVIYEGGEPVRMVGTMQDITEKKRAELRLRESEEKHRLLFSNMNEGVALHEVVYSDKGRPVDYVILDVNPCYEKITGICREDAVGQRASVVYGEESAPYLGEYSRVVETGEPLVFETYYPPLDKYFWISAFQAGEGRFATVFMDLTMQKRLEHDLTVKEERMRNVFRVSPHALAVTDLEGNLVDCNDAALEMFGFSELGEVVGVNCFSFVSPEDLERASENWVERVRTGLVDKIEYRLVGGDGRVFPALVSASVMRNDAGEPAGFVLNIEDISDRKYLEEELMEHTTRLLDIAEQSLWDQYSSPQEA
jgi:PAS domain S-box-containing protein